MSGQRLLFLVPYEARLHIQFSIRSIFHIQPDGRLQAVSLFGGHKQPYRSIPVKGSGITENTLLRKGSIKIQRGDHFLDKRAGMKDLHLVVEIVGHREHSEILDGGQGAARSIHALGVFLLNQNGGGYIVNRRLETKVDPSAYQKNDH